MTVLLGPVAFTGGDVGTACTSATEPVFTSHSGVATYAEAPGGTRGVRFDPSTFSPLFNNTALPGRTTYRFGWKYTHESSSAADTSSYELVLLRAGTTIAADVSMRNASGARTAAFRDNFAVIGQTAAMPPGATWRFEWLVEDGASTVSIWFDHTAVGTAPDVQFTDPALAVSGIDNFFIGPSTSTLVSGVMSELWVTDGESLYDAPPPAGTLNLAHAGAADADTIRVLTKTTDATELVLRHSANPDLSGAVLEAPVAPDPSGYTTLTAAGLPADTVRYWAVEVDGIQGAHTGRARTLPAAGSPASFRFGWGACFDVGSSAVFDLIAARDPAFFVQVGDFGYQYTTLGATPDAPLTPAANRTDREPMLTQSGLRALFAQAPWDYMYSDVDGGGGNGDGTKPGFGTGAVQEAFRHQFGHRPFPLADCGARSWVVGRIRFVLTDETTLASAKAAADDATKSKLGATQKAWFKAEIDAAAAAGQVVVWLGDGPWIEPTLNTGNTNTWMRYNTERTELGAHVAAAGMSARLIRLHGDTHTLFADDGTNNPWGGFPSCSGGPMHTTAHPFATAPVSNGYHPLSTINSARQYGTVDVADDGTTVTMTMRGWASTNAAPAETNPVTMVVTSTPGGPPPAGPILDAVIVGEASRPVAAEHVIVGGTKRVVVAVHLVAGGAERPLP